MKVIDVQGLTKRYGDFTAVDQVSFQVGYGEIFGLLGPNGMGKTSTIRILTGLSRATEGSCLIFGEEMTPNNKQVLSRMGVVFEEPNLYSRLSGLQNLEFFATLYGVEKTKVHELLGEFRLTGAGSKPVAHYSKGMKQRLLICRALLNDPDLLVLDEPTSGLDLESVELIRGKILEFAEAGKGVFMSTHSLEEADELCHNVAFINHGQIIAQGDPASFKLSYGQGVLKVDFISTLPNDELPKFLKELELEVSSQEAEVVSLIMPLNQEDLGVKLDKLKTAGRILRIHSQEASLREVFKAVIDTDD